MNPPVVAALVDIAAETYALEQEHAVADNEQAKNK